MKKKDHYHYWYHHISLSRSTTPVIINNYCYQYYYLSLDVNSFTQQCYYQIDFKIFQNIFNLLLKEKILPLNSIHKIEFKFDSLSS